MNRHERRRQKKTNKLNQSVNQDLLEGIKLHTNKNYVKAEAYIIKFYQVNLKIMRLSGT